MKYTPNGKRLIVSRKKHDIKTKSGIVLPDAVTEKKLSEGYIERVGTNCAEHWDEGMYVIFTQFAGQEIKVDDQAYLVMPEEDVLVYGFEHEEE
jgi:chaperonin GroES|tara:strand:- start:1133 stop:1414 length:282 start_codon:yes stop_codon:yes gene_type:complete